MVIIYDLRILPATFDFAYFCCLAYGLALKQGIKKPQFTPIIITGISKRCFSGEVDFANANNDEEILRRVHKLLLPLANMMPFLNAPLV